MKKKLIALWHKIKTMKKRVWLILSALLAITLVITWHSLDYTKKREIKAMLGNIRAIRDIEWEKTQRELSKICDSKEEWSEKDTTEAKQIFNFYININALDELLDWVRVRGKTKDNCKLEQVEELASVARLVLKENFEIKGDYSADYNYPALEKFVQEKSDSIYDLNLFRFYMDVNSIERNLTMDMVFKYIRVNGYSFRELLSHFEQKFLEKQDYEKLYLLAYSVQKIKSNEFNEFNEDLIRIYNSIVKANPGWPYHLVNSAKYNIAKLTLEKDPQNKDALNTIHQLAEGNFGSALVLLGDIAIQDYNDHALGMNYYYKAADKWNSIEGYDRLFRKYYIFHMNDEKLLELLEEKDDFAKYGSTELDFINDFRRYSSETIKSIVDNDIYLNESTYNAEQIGRILFLKKKYEEAEEFFQEILRKTNRSKIALSKLGDIYYQGLGRRQELEKAHEYYGKACDLKYQYGCDKYREVNEKIYRVESKR